LSQPRRLPSGSSALLVVEPAPGRVRGPRDTVRMLLLRTATIICYYRHLFTIIATPTVLWRPLRRPQSTVRTVLLRTSTRIGCYINLFTIIATPTAPWRPLTEPVAARQVERAQAAPLQSSAALLHAAASAARLSSSAAQVFEHCPGSSAAELSDSGSSGGYGSVHLLSPCPR